MRIFLGCLTGFLLLNLFLSCQKEIKWDPSKLHPTYLTEYVVLDTSWVPGKDTLLKVKLYLDSKKRNSRYFSTRYQANASFQSSPLYVHDFRYTYNDDRDSFPSQVTDSYQHLVNPADRWSQTIHLWFQGGSVIRDSTVNIFLSTERNAWDNPSPGKYRRFYSSTSPLIKDTSYSTIVINNGNLVFERDSIYNQIVFVWRTTDWGLDHDVVTNPMDRFFLPYLTPFNKKGLNYYNLFYDYGFPGKNNPLVYSKNNSFQRVWTYTYNKDGFPVIARMSDKLKAFYYYTTF